MTSQPFTIFIKFFEITEVSENYTQTEQEKAEHCTQIQQETGRTLKLPYQRGKYRLPWKPHGKLSFIKYFSNFIAR